MNCSALGAGAKQWLGLPRSIVDDMHLTNVVQYIMAHDIIVFKSLILLENSCVTISLNF